MVGFHQKHRFHFFCPNVIVFCFCLTLSHRLYSLLFKNCLRRKPKPLNNLTSEAVAGGSLRKYAAGSAITTDFKKLYALVQCTPDLSKQDCTNWLLITIAVYPQYCAGKVGRSVLLTSCKIRYEDYSFYYYFFIIFILNSFYFRFYD